MQRVATVTLCAPEWFFLIGSNFGKIDKPSLSLLASLACRCLDYFTPQMNGGAVNNTHDFIVLRMPTSGQLRILGLTVLS